MKFGDYLKHKREENSWTQPEAAKMADIEQSYLSKLESSKSYPSEEIFDRLIKLYSINLEKLNKVIDSDEYEKLSDIKQMRKLIISQKKAQVTVVKSWLIYGLACLMLSGACLAVSQLYSSAQEEYFYRSNGIILPNESLQVFNILYETFPNQKIELIEKQQKITSRINQHDITTTSFRGDSYVVETPEGKRHYELKSRQDASQQSAMNWFLVPGLMLLFGSLGCFYISYRWEQ